LEDAPVVGLGSGARPSLRAGATGARVYYWSLRPRWIAFASVRV
jgi:hypothetical protein